VADVTAARDPGVDSGSTPCRRPARASLGGCPMIRPFGRCLRMASAASG